MSGNKNIDITKRITKGWISLEREITDATGNKTTLKLSNEVVFFQDCDAETVASVFDFQRSCLDNQKQVENATVTKETTSEKYSFQDEQTQKPRTIEAPISTIEAIGNPFDF